MIAPEFPRPEILLAASSGWIPDAKLEANVIIIAFYKGYLKASNVIYNLIGDIKILL
jgi:hypothetical protein